MASVAPATQSFSFLGELTSKFTRGQQKKESARTLRRSAPDAEYCSGQPVPQAKPSFGVKPVPASGLRASGVRPAIHHASQYSPLQPSWLPAHHVRVVASTSDSAAGSVNGDLKDITVIIPLEDGSFKQVRFSVYSREKDDKIMRSHSGIGLVCDKPGSTEQDVILDYEELRSGSTYYLSRSLPAVTQRVHNLEGWQKHMTIGHEEESAERLVAIALTHASGAQVTRIDKKIFYDKKGHLLKELDACIVVGETAFIGEAKTTLRPRDVAKFSNTLKDVRDHVVAHEGDFDILRGKRIVGCMLTRALPEDRKEREDLLEIAKELNIIIEVPNGASWSTGNSLFWGDDWGAALEP